MSIPPIRISPGYTNLVSNPVAETNTTGWRRYAVGTMTDASTVRQN